MSPDLAGQWEAYRQIVVEQPFPERAARAGDRRAPIAAAPCSALYDLSEKIGVSPWHWFADVPVQPQGRTCISPPARVATSPRCATAASSSTTRRRPSPAGPRKQFGGANSKMYAHVFELLLRLKGNYLWPAMWAPRAFNDDDPQNMVLADAMGVVMGTSHHEPMTRAQDEWHRNKEQGVTGGKWNYTTNAENLRKFWRGGIERMMSKGDGQRYESVVTVGMRGDGDEPMSESTATQLLESIVADQRDIIARRHRQARRADAAGLGALQGSAGLLRPRHEGARRRHAAVRRRQLGPDPPPADRRSRSQGRLRRVLPLRLRRRRRATTSGSTPTRSRRSGSRWTWRTSAARGRCGS